MKDTPKLLIVSIAGDTSLATALGHRFAFVVEKQAARVMDTALRLSPRAVLFDLGGEPNEETQQAIRAMAELHRVRPALPIVAVADKKDADLILHAMRAGAREFVVQEQPNEILRVLLSLTQGEGSVTQGSITSVFAAKGGSGATMIAANLAGSLLDDGRRVLLVDLDLQLGGAHVLLDLDCGFTVADMLAQMQRLDRDLLLSSLTRHPSGLYVLSQSERLEEADRVRPSDIPTMLRFLAEHFDHIVLDGLFGFDELAMSALDASDRVLLLLTQDVPAVKNAHRCSDVFRRLGYDDRKISVVVNRYDKGDPIDLVSIENTLVRQVAATVANDFRAVKLAIDKGVHISIAAPRSKVTDDLRRLASVVSGRAEDKKQGFFAGLFNRSQGGVRDGAQRTLETVR
jgi:pilus assembly protein CpaE